MRGATDIFIELPGAAVRWLIGKLLGSKRSFVDYFMEESFVNLILGIILWFFGILVYNWIK
jgi:hypothetical protein